jgi:hypothetical protein
MHYADWTDLPCLEKVLLFVLLKIPPTYLRLAWRLSCPILRAEVCRHDIHSSVSLLGSLPSWGEIWVPWIKDPEVGYCQ